MTDTTPASAASSAATPQDAPAAASALPEQIAQIRESLGLDQPFLPRLLSWFGAVLQGDLGTSIFTGQPVTKMILERIGPTFSLMLVTLVFAVIVAVPVGVIAAYRHNTLLDNAIMAAAVLGFSVPVFVLGYLGVWAGFSTIGALGHWLMANAGLVAAGGRRG